MTDTEEFKATDAVPQARQLEHALKTLPEHAEVRVLLGQELDQVQAEGNSEMDTRGYCQDRLASSGTGVFPGRPDQVQRVRQHIARYLAGHPDTDDAVLVTSELASNSILHSDSNGQAFTVRVQVRTGYIWLEVQDSGGPWLSRSRDPDRPHGLDLVEALAGPGNWGVDGDEAGRVVWCRLGLGNQR